MTPTEKKQRKADEAKQLLNNPVLQEALKGLRDTCFYNIETSSHDQSQQREDLYYMLRCISAFERKLKQYINEGQATIANLNIKHLIK